jgi:DNA polymerase-3 subunit gamma/tau
MAVEQVVPGALDATDPDTDAARQLAPVLAPDETQLLYSMVLQGRAELSLAPDEYAGLVMVLLRFLAFPAQDGGASRSAPAPKPVAAPAPASAALQARVAERARAVVPPPAITRPVVPPATAPVPPSVAAAAPKPAPPPPRPSAAQTEEEPPPWMDEAPFEGEAVAAPVPSGEPAVRMPPPSAAPEVPAVQRTALGDRWAEVVNALVAANSVTALARELAMQAELTLVEPGEGGERWCVRVDRETLRAATLSDKLQAALRAHTGLSVRLEVVAGTPVDSPARREVEAAAQRQREAETIIHGDPLVQSMLAQFSTARIVPGSIRPA